MTFRWIMVLLPLHFTASPSAITERTVSSTASPVLASLESWSPLYSMCRSPAEPTRCTPFLTLPSASHLRIDACNVTALPLLMQQRSTTGIEVGSTVSGIDSAAGQFVLRDRGLVLLLPSAGQDLSCSRARDSPNHSFPWNATTILLSPLDTRSILSLQVHSAFHALTLSLSLFPPRGADFTNLVFQRSHRSFPASREAVAV